MIKWVVTDSLIDFRSSTIREYNRKCNKKKKVKVRIIMCILDNPQTTNKSTKSVTIYEIKECYIKHYSISQLL